MQIIKCQQGTPEWLQARLEKITGTRLACALGTPLKQEALINELIAEKLTGQAKDNYVNLAMLKGSEAEDYAIGEYELLTGEITEKVGLCISDEYGWLANSPDRLIAKDGKYRKAVEVKSPNTDTQVKYIRAGGVPEEYKTQVMSYFLVNEDLEELDFITYDPRINTEQYRLFVVNVKREDLPLEETKTALLKFYAKYEEALKKLNLTI